MISFAGLSRRKGAAGPNPHRFILSCPGRAGRWLCCGAVSSLLLIASGCSTLDTFFFEELDRQEMRIAADPAYFHGEEVAASEEQKKLLQVCLGKRRIGSLGAFRISDAALICAATGSPEQSEELFKLALDRSSGLDRRRIMLNRLIVWKHTGGGVRENNLAPVLTDLSHTVALTLVKELQEKKQDWLVDRLYAFMIPRSRGAALADVLLQKGIYEYSMGRSGPSRLALEQSLQLRKDRKAYLILGNLYADSGDYERAQQNLKTAYDLGADSEVAFSLARLEFEKAQFRQALDWIQKADKANPEALELHGLILLSLDVAADPRPLLKNLTISARGPECIQPERPFLEDFALCSTARTYDVLRPMRTRGRILRSWFGTTRLEGRQNLVPYIKGNY